MSKESKNIVSEALLELDSLKEAFKESSKSSLKNMLGEAVKDVLRESIEDEKDEDDEYEVEESTDDKNENNDSSEKSGDVSEDMNNDEMSQENPGMENPDMNQTDGMEQNQAANTQEAPMNGEGEQAGDDWSQFSQYQTGDDNTYDLTGEQDYSQIVKVYKLMQDTDQVVVKKEGNTVQLTDGGTGAEYVIDLSGDDEEPMEGQGEEMTEGVIKEGYFDDDDDYGIDTSFEDEIIRNARKFRPSKKDLKDLEDDLEPAGFEDEIEIEDEPLDDEISDEPRFDESKKRRKTMKENKQLVFEVDLGYTDNYQSKDPVQGLNNSEPSKSGKSWEKGVPTGTEKPWAGSSKDKSEPFEKTVNEEEVDECGIGGCAPSEEPVVDEGTNVGGAVQQRSNSKSHIPDNRKEHGPKNKRHVSAGGNYEEMIESYKKEIAKLKKINEAYKKENAQLKECAKELGNNIKESYVVNTNLAKITRLFTENVVNQQERINIVNRFANEAKTVEQSNALYESINNELKKNGNKNLTLENNAPVKAEQNNQLNEVKKSKGLMNTLDLIKRMSNL